MATVNDYARTTWQTGDVIDATKMNNIETQLDAVTDNARDNGTAPVFSTTKTYAVGEHVLYNGEVYKCKTAVTSAGAWVASNWVKAYLSSDMEGEVSELKSAFDTTVDTELLDSIGTIPARFTSSTGWKIIGGSQFRTVYYRLSGAEKAIQVSKISHQPFTVGFTEQVPNSNVDVIGGIEDPFASEIFVNVPDGANYLVVYYYNSNTATLDEPVLLQSIVARAYFAAKDDTARSEIALTNAEMAKVWDGDNGVTTPTRNDLIDKFGIYSENIIYSAANAIVGNTFPDVPTTTSNNAYTILIDLEDVQSITYPMYKNTVGRGCLLLDKNMVITRNLPNITAEHGTLNTIEIGANDKYFVFTYFYTLQAWDLVIRKTPRKGLLEISDDLDDVNNEIEDINASITTLTESKTAILNAEIVGFICYGQSWSMGYDTNAIVSTQRYDNLMLESGLMNDPASDLVVSASAFSPLVESTVWSNDNQSQKCGETPCTGQTDIVKQLLLSENGLSDTDVKYQIFSAAPGMGSKSIEQLSKGTVYYQRLIDVVTAANNIARSQGKVFVIPAVSWTQENSTSSDATYYDLLEQLRLDLDADIKAITGQSIPVKLIAWQAITPNTTPKRFYDRYVYASEKYENIICSGTFYNFEHKADNNLHLIANHQDLLGCQLGIAYKRSIIDGEKFIPLKPKKVEVYGNIAYLDFYVPVKPLVFDTTLVASIDNMGFQVFDGSNIEKTISSVEIIAPDRVKIVCASDFESTDHIVYGGNGTSAYNPQTGKRGNLRDSQPIVYKNHANIDLPCYNWCVVFDKTIAELAEDN